MMEEDPLTFSPAPSGSSRRPEPPGWSYPNEARVLPVREPAPQWGELAELPAPRRHGVLAVCTALGLGLFGILLHLLVRVSLLTGDGPLWLGTFAAGLAVAAAWWLPNPDRPTPGLVRAATLVALAVLFANNVYMAHHLGELARQLQNATQR